MSKSKTILWANLDYDIRTGKESDFNVNAIFINPINSTVNVVIEKRGTMEVKSIEITTHQAVEIGFINLNALSYYCNF